jgi:hypothetical protein
MTTLDPHEAVTFHPLDAEKPAATDTPTLELMRSEALTLVEMGFASYPGEPTLAFYDNKTDVLVVVCPVPMIGCDEELPTGLTFNFRTVYTKANYEDTKTLTPLVLKALSAFDLRTVAAAEQDNLCHVAYSEPFDLNSNGRFSIMGRVTFETSPTHIIQIMNLLSKQLEAAALVLKTSAQPLSTN